MEHQIVKMPAFSVVGMEYRGKNENKEISQLWEALNARIQEIKHMVDIHVGYGLCGDLDPDTGEFDYMAAMEVDSLADIPEGMVSWELPEQTYAVFTCSLPTIGDTFEHIYKTWLPQSGYERDSGPDFEYYDERFRIEDPESELDLYIPIKQAGDPA